MPQRRLVVAQHLDLVLREVADSEPLAVDGRALQRRERPGDGLDQGRLARAIDAEKPDALLRLQRKLDVLQHPLFRVAGVHVVENQQRIRGTQRLAELERKRRRDVQRRELLHFRQHLHAALRLAGLGGLGLEAVDERLQVRALARLLFLLAGGEDQRLGALRFEARIVARIAPELARVDMHDGIDHAIEKIAVVRYDDQGPAVAFQPVFEPDDRVEVEVVGRLIEQQQVGPAHQRLREVEPHAPAAREARHRQVELVCCETQAC